MIDWDYSSKGKVLCGGSASKQLTKPFRCVHVAGLPLAEGVPCEIDMCPDRFVISGTGGSFELAKAKVTGIERVTRKQLTQVSKGSPGKAVLGGVAFGVIGAVVGASIGTTKTLKRCENFAVFTYEGREGPTCLVFAFKSDDNQMGSAKQTLRKFIKDFEDGYGYGKAAVIEL